MNDLSKILRQARREARREKMKDSAKRPLCWILGHQWIRKMDLRGAAICGRCTAYRSS